MTDIKEYYFVSPEHQIAWIQRLFGAEFERLKLDPLVEVVDRETYLKACAAWGCEP